MVIGMDPLVGAFEDIREIVAVDFVPGIGIDDPYRPEPILIAAASSKERI